MNGKGELKTRKLTVNGKCSMHVNVQGKIKATILDENGKLIAESNEYKGDSTNAKLCFNDFDISSLNGKTFSISFAVDGKFYSFGFADQNGAFGGAHGAGIVK